MENNDISIKLFDLCIFSREKIELLNQIETAIENSSKISYIFTPNPEQIVQSRGKSKVSKQFLADLQQADWLIPDGVGIVLASRYLSKSQNKTISNFIKERIAGVDLVVDLCDLLRKKKTKVTPRVLIVGGKGYTPEDIQNFAFPNLDIKWTPAFTDAKNPTDQENGSLEELIRNFKPTIVFVALGAPTQERWLIQNRRLLEKNGVRIGMAVGGSFDYLFGKVSRAPQWLRSLGGEWLFRLFAQPWRLKRQLRLVVFVWLVLMEKFKN